MARPVRYWLRPRISPDGDIRWAIIETAFRPTPESLGPFPGIGEAVSAAEPDGTSMEVETLPALA